MMGRINGYAPRGGAFFGNFISICLMMILIILSAVLLYYIIKLLKSINKYKCLDDHLNKSHSPVEQQDLSMLSNNAISILNERYARGEITEEEYAIKKDTILKP